MLPSGSDSSDLLHGHAHTSFVRLQSFGSTCPWAVMSASQYEQRRELASMHSAGERNAELPHEGHMTLFLFGGLHRPQSGLHDQHIDALPFSRLR